jgi:NitT/TauT family transport system substrate-binding protein
MLGLMLTVGCTNPAVYIKTTTESAAVAATTDSDLSAINLGFSAWPGWFPWQVAQDEGIFQAKGAPVDLK